MTVMKMMATVCLTALLAGACSKSDVKSGEGQPVPGAVQSGDSQVATAPGGMQSQNGMQPQNGMPGGMPQNGGMQSGMQPGGAPMQNGMPGGTQQGGMQGMQPGGAPLQNGMQGGMQQGGMQPQSGMQGPAGADPLDQLMAWERQDHGVAPTSALHNGPMEGQTPTQIPGGQVITTKGLVPLLQGGQMPVVVLDVLGAQQTLPKAIPAAFASQPGSFNDQVQQQFAQLLAQATQGNKQTPLVLYCLGPTCWMSYNAALRAINLGYSNVLWYRGGYEAWQQAGMPMVPAPQAGAAPPAQAGYGQPVQPSQPAYSSPGGYSQAPGGYSQPAGNNGAQGGYAAPQQQGGYAQQPQQQGGYNQGQGYPAAPANSGGYNQPQGNYGQ